VFGETRYARVGNRLARWRASDPRLSVVKELLWALEQPEAAGYTRLALAGMTALGKLVPISDLRYGYVAVQSARAVRTLGNSQGAVERYAVGERLGHRYRDRWLCARSATGLGATYLYLGNYPAARAVFHSVVAEKLPDASLTATAHHGLLISAMAAQNWDAAIAQGWHLLQAGKAGAVARTDVLNLMANLCQRIGRYRAAIRAAESALQLAVRADQVVASLAVLVDVATVTSNRELGRQYGPLLRKHVRGSAGPYEDARALLALAGLEYMCGTRDAAYADLASARVIADRLGYHELQFEVEKLSAAFSRNSDTSAEMGSAQTSPAVDVLLSQPSRYIMSKLDNWGEHDIPNAAVAFQ
jgi:tetratricopeptide (TPR) repeat protein